MTWLLIFRKIISIGRKDEGQISFNAKKEAAASLGHSLQLLNRQMPHHDYGLKDRIQQRLRDWRQIILKEGYNQQEKMG